MTRKKPARTGHSRRKGTMQPTYRYSLPRSPSTIVLRYWRLINLRRLKRYHETRFLKHDIIEDVRYSYNLTEEKRVYAYKALLCHRMVEKCVHNVMFRPFLKNGDFWRHQFNIWHVIEQSDYDTTFPSLNEEDQAYRDSLILETNHNCDENDDNLGDSLVRHFNIDPSISQQQQELQQSTIIHKSQQIRGKKASIVKKKLQSLQHVQTVMNMNNINVLSRINTSIDDDNDDDAIDNDSDDDFMPTTSFFYSRDNNHRRDDDDGNDDDERSFTSSSSSSSGSSSPSSSFSSTTTSSTTTQISTIPTPAEVSGQQHCLCDDDDYSYPPQLPQTHSQQFFFHPMDPAIHNDDDGGSVFLQNYSQSKNLQSQVSTTTSTTGEVTMSFPYDSCDDIDDMSHIFAFFSTSATNSNNFDMSTFPSLPPNDVFDIDLPPAHRYPGLIVPAYDALHAANPLPGVPLNQPLAPMNAPIALDHYNTSIFTIPQYQPHHHQHHYGQTNHHPNDLILSDLLRHNIHNSLFEEDHTMSFFEEKSTISTLYCPNVSHIFSSWHSTLRFNADSNGDPEEIFLYDNNIAQTLFQQYAQEEFSFPILFQMPDQQSK